MKDTFLRIWQQLKKPRAAIFALSCVITALLSTGSLCILLIDYEGTALEYVAYVLFGLAAISLTYTVYGFVLYIPRWKKSLTAWLNTIPLTAKLMKNYGFRTVLFSALSLTISILYGLYNGVIALIFHSIWYGALAAYYIILVCMRGGIVLYHGKKRGKERKDATEMRKYRNCGILLIVTILALSIAILQMVAAGAGFEKQGLMIYVAATYTFYKMTMSIVNIFKARRSQDYTVQTLRNVNLADALV